MINNIKEDILKIYNRTIDNNQLGKLGYPNHDVLQKSLKEIAVKYNLTYKTEYTGTLYFDTEKQKNKKGRIDIVYYNNNQPFIALEIDCGLKKTSIKKLLANSEFKYRIWFCYNRKIETDEYYNLINRYDKNNELIYLTANRWAK